MRLLRKQINQDLSMNLVFGMAFPLNILLKLLKKVLALILLPESQKIGIMNLLDLTLVLDRYPKLKVENL